LWNRVNRWHTIREEKKKEHRDATKVDVGNHGKIKCKSPTDAQVEKIVDRYVGERYYWHQHPCILSRRGQLGLRGHQREVNLTCITYDMLKRRRLENTKPVERKTDPTPAP